MAVPLGALTVFADQRRSTLTSVSELLRADSGVDSDNPRITDVILRLFGFGGTSASVGSVASSPTLLLETEYGLRLELHDGCAFRISIYREHHPLLEAHEYASVMDAGTFEALESQDCHRYRLFPDWQTSYLWCDNREALPSSGQDHIDPKVIKRRYPTLAPYYFKWQTIHETAFERQECYLEAGEGAFPEVRDRVAWETEGLLIACWLALQGDVKSVEYKPSGTYTLEKGTIGQNVYRFLADMEALLES
ncbi:hypothetical protein GP486_008453 [Trichoglossum hirsutum]|uniref:Uncharacterized protein n=1 Tax=Trichoglossum hirsutum TaxID=265104 RepID=A0A9P8L6S9_9PEZI|nr:hypothetical protein GP486_008453 [Trichoglossum hirsutum]